MGRQEAPLAPQHAGRGLGQPLVGRASSLLSLLYPKLGKQVSRPGASSGGNMGACGFLAKTPVTYTKTGLTLGLTQTQTSSLHD